jgi:hypothetical protein
MVQRLLKQSSQLGTMARRVGPFILAFFAALALAGCGFFGRPERPIWRTQAENACFGRKLVTLSDAIVAARPIDGPGVCGMTRPLQVSALAGGSVALDKALTIDCPMIPALETWLKDVVQPIDNLGGERLSEHAFGNAVDVAGFTLADGRTIAFVSDWKKQGVQEAAFLHEAHAGACRYFTTVLGPGADAFHYNHIHLDLANHGATDTGPRRICKPTPEPSLLPPPVGPDGLPPAPEIEEPLDIARLRASPSNRAVALAPMSLTPGDGLSGAVPPPVPEADPAPPVLPASAGPSVDRQPTSSIGDDD